MVKDAEMFHLESDIQKIQVKTNLYLQDYGRQGSFHLAKELAQNNIDECLDEDSQGNTIEYSYDRDTDIFICEDNGRGFPETKYDLKIYCTTLQSGSKFYRSGTADSAGEFGIGLTVVCALSEYFRLESFREVENIHHILEFNNGVLVKDEIKKITGKKKHGTKISFKASSKYLGDKCDLPIENVVSWLESLFYLNSEKLEKRNISCKLTIYNGLEVEKTYKFKPKPFHELLQKIIPASSKKKELSSLMYISGDTTFIENSKMLIDDGKGNNNVEIIPTEKNIHMDVALQYNLCSTEPAVYDTYCNYTNTIDNGVHLLAFEDCFCRYMQSKVYATMSDSQKSKYKVTWDDIRSSMYCVINLSSNASVGFVGNQKQAIGNKALIPYMKTLLNDLITKFFDKNNSILNEYIKIIKLNTKSRIEAQKAKISSQTEKLNTFKEHRQSCAL